MIHQEAEKLRDMLVIHKPPGRFLRMLLALPVICPSGRSFYLCQTRGQYVSYTGLTHHHLVSCLLVRHSKPVALLAVGFLWKHAPHDVHDYVVHCSREVPTYLWEIAAQLEKCCGMQVAAGEDKASEGTGGSGLWNSKGYKCHFDWNRKVLY